MSPVSSMQLIELPGVRHLTSAEVREEVLDLKSGEVISDRAAATIASWYQSPGIEGASLSALASGCAVKIDDLEDDLLRVERKHYSRASSVEQHALDCLGAWLMAKRGYGQS